MAGGCGWHGRCWLARCWLKHRPACRRAPAVWGGGGPALQVSARPMQPPTSLTLPLAAGGRLEAVHLARAWLGILAHPGGHAGLGVAVVLQPGAWGAGAEAGTCGKTHGACKCGAGLAQGAARCSPTRILPPCLLQPCAHCPAHHGLSLVHVGEARGADRRQAVPVAAVAGCRPRPRQGRRRGLRKHGQAAPAAAAVCKEGQGTLQAARAAGRLTGIGRVAGGVAAAVLRYREGG